MPASRVKRLDWALTALDDYEAGLAYIAQDNPAAALLVQSRIEKAGELIATNPGIGTPGFVAGTRHFSVHRTRYTLIYEESTDAVLILHCWHQSRDISS
jgi:toxin ParE1/3/4